MKKRYIEMSVEELEEKIRSNRSTSYLMIFVFAFLGLSGFFVLLFLDLTLIGCILLFLSTLYSLAVMFNITIHNHLLLLLFLKQELGVVR